jgi:putative transposase
MRTPRDPIYAGHRYPAEIICYAVWLYFRFPLSLRMVEEMLAARSISVTHETIRQWGLKFGREFAGRIRRRAPLRGDKWHLDEVVVSNGSTYRQARRLGDVVPFRCAVKFEVSTIARR